MNEYFQYVLRYTPWVRTNKNEQSSFEVVQMVIKPDGGNPTNGAFLEQINFINAIVTEHHLFFQ